MKTILPNWLYVSLSAKYSLDDIQEIRLRVNQPIQINYKGKNISLMNESGLYLKPIIASGELIEYVISMVTKNSVYAFEDQIKSGYITASNGIRIGLCGTAVMKNGEVSFLKKITSLNIRIAHRVVGCSKNIMNYLVVNGVVKNTLIVSSPGAGKTTLIRDIIERLSDQFSIPNIMVIDERYELGGEGSIFNLGANVDLLQGSDKQFGFYEAIKVMNPNVIVTDEIIFNEDIDGIRFAIGSGVKVIATVHADGVDALKLKRDVFALIEEKKFERIIILSKRHGVGTIDAVLNENLTALYIPAFL